MKHSTRIYRTPKQTELLLIREFVDVLGYRISYCKGRESPDALLTLNRGKEKKRVAIEHTEYFSDTVAGKRSPLTPMEDFWEDVRASLVRRVSHRRHLCGMRATVRFKENLQKPKNCKALVKQTAKKLAKQLAEELVNFMESHPVKRRQCLPFRHRDFNEYATLTFLLCSLALLRWTDNGGRTSRCSWICSNITAGHIGVNLDYIKSAIENKNKKAKNYDWHAANENWLLIAASGSTVSNAAGPPGQNVNWADTALLGLCRDSPFDRIAFWERTCRWYKWLKPCKEEVEYKDR